jgi:glutamate carboxypeptidase
VTAPGAGAAAPVAGEVRARLQVQVDDMAALLGRMVRIESGSDDPEGLDRMAALLEGLFGELGPVSRHPAGPGGAHLTLSLDGADAALPHVVVLGHYDTVWPRGTLDRIPFAVDHRGVITGPGCFDMKGGLVLLYCALRQLRELGRDPRRPLRVLLTCDEEVRSRTSRELIRRTALGAAAALVLESPLPGGALKTARKGTATYQLLIEGRAAHAGIEPGKGVSAILELTHQVQALHALADSERGTTVNVGVIRGGTRPNVVAAGAEAEIDVRVSTSAEAERVDRSIRRLAPVLPGTRLTVVADLTRPPMESTPASRRLFARAAAIAERMGVADLAGGATGGASDANLVAAAGIPTLDGLGPEGGGAHADDEHVLLASMPFRAALLAGLLAEI